MTEFKKIDQSVDRTEDAEHSNSDRSKHSKHWYSIEPDPTLNEEEMIKSWGAVLGWLWNAKTGQQKLVDDFETKTQMNFRILNSPKQIALAGRL